MIGFIPVKGYEGYYSINKEGDVVSSYYGITLKHGESAGYPRVTLYKPGKRGKGKTIHRLLAEHFIPNPDNLPQVNHIDGDRYNFSLDNLEWVTASENVKDGFLRGRVTPNKGKRLAHYTRDCEGCKQEYVAGKKHQRFCSAKCSARWRVKAHPHTVGRQRDPKTGRIVAIELFKQGVLSRES